MRLAYFVVLMGVMGGLGSCSADSPPEKQAPQNSQSSTKSNIPGKGRIPNRAGC